MTCERPRILIVDDEEANICLLRRVLTGAGYVDLGSTTDPLQQPTRDAVPPPHRQRAGCDTEAIVAERTRELDEGRIEILERLACAAEFRDDDTGHHTQRVGELPVLLARARAPLGGRAADQRLSALGDVPLRVGGAVLRGGGGGRHPHRDGERRRGGIEGRARGRREGARAGRGVVRRVRHAAGGGARRGRRCRAPRGAARHSAGGIRVWRAH
jgi:hypothetical protein